jgi:hypothetical protein
VRFLAQRRNVGRGGFAQGPRSAESSPAARVKLVGIRRFRGAHTIFLQRLGRSEGDGVRAGMPGNALEAQVAIEELASCARVLANAATLRVTPVQVNAVKPDRISGGSPDGAARSKQAVSGTSIRFQFTSREMCNDSWTARLRVSG